MLNIFDLSNGKVKYFKPVRADIGDRLRVAREGLGLTQAELAQATGVSRATQINYERGDTEPTTAYLRAAQTQGIDVSDLLFGPSLLDAADLHSAATDWALVQLCAENVEFFCLRFAPTCPASFRWKMISQLYAILSAGKDVPHSELQTADPRALLDAIWEQYGK